MLRTLFKQLLKSFVIKSLKQYNILQILLVIFRIIPCYFLLAYDIFFQTYIAPLIPISQIRRYISSITNLICLRFVLYIFGVIRFQSQNLNYFLTHKTKLRFNSGWIGVSSRTSFLDFLYLSCNLNPTFVRMVQFHEPQNQNKLNNIKMLYIPLTFQQALYASLDYHGFDPIVIKSKQQFRKLKVRKVQMKLLIAQCHQHKLGPIIVFLPQISPYQQLDMNPKLYDSMKQNQRLFVRQGQAFNIKLQKIKKNKNCSKQNQIIFYKNQINLMIQLCSKFIGYQLQIKNGGVTSNHQFQPYNFLLQKPILQNVVNKFYQENGYRISKLTYTQYLIQNANKKQQQNMLENKVNQKKQKKQKQQKTKANTKKNFNRSMKTKQINFINNNNNGQQKMNQNRY